MKQLSLSKLAEIIIVNRKKKSLTQQQLSDVTNINRATISRIEAKDFIPSIPQYKENVSYEKGYEVLTYVKANRTTDLFTLFDDVWGNWLRKGYHRFPENFSPKKTGREELAFYSRPYGLSLCHGANGAAACMAVLYGILGFSQSEEHPEEYTLRPNLLHLNKIYARIPVKEGYITVHIERNGHSTVDAPEGCIVHLIQ